MTKANGASDFGLKAPSNGSHGAPPLNAGRSLWSPQAQMPRVLKQRIEITSASGAYLYTRDGQKLLDATAGLWLANIGHSRPEMAQAAYDQMSRLENFHIFGRFYTDRAAQLADRLAALSPIPKAKVFFGSGGGDAVEIASKLSRLHWQLAGRPEKRVILSREGGYHGLHAFGTSLAGLDYNRDGYGSPTLVPEVARIPQNDLAGVDRVIEEVGPERIAALFAEPVIGSGGVIEPTDGYLTGLRDLTNKHKILLVADEVITGFGRTGRMFASEKYGITPDMLLFAKGVTSGYAPMGGVLIAESVWSRFYENDDAPIFRHGLTYAGHTTACAMAEVNLDILESEHLVARASVLTDLLARGLAPLREHPLVAEVRAGAALLAGVRLRPDVSAVAVTDHTIEQGVSLRVIHDNTIQISPPFIVTDDEIRAIVQAVTSALATQV